MTRDELLAICERAFVPQEHWRNRDSSAAQRQVGECYALLRAGCDFTTSPDTRHDTVWVHVWFHGFDHFEYGRGEEHEQFYLPTVERLDRSDGGDWY